MSPRFRRIGFSLLAIVLPAPAPAPADEPATPPAAARSETLVRADGGRIPGKLSGQAAAGFVFLPEGAATPLPLEPGAVVAFEGPGPDPSSGFPPFQLHLGLGQRVSGRLGSVTESTIHLADGPGGRPIALPRDAARALLQRAGEAQVFRDGFEAIESKRWARIGDPEIVDEPRTEGEHSLRIPAGGTSLTCGLPEPVGSGRLEIAYHDTLVVAPDQQRVVDLTFRGPAGPETIRVVLGWSEESLAVESPTGPALAVQHLARREGWHRLSVRFGPEMTEIAVDGDELAHGKGPGGPLVEIRLASYPIGKSMPPPGLAGHFDDLSLVAADRAHRRPRDRRHPGRGPPGQRRPGLRDDPVRRRRSGGLEGRPRGGFTPLERGVGPPLPPGPEPGPTDRGPARPAGMAVRTGRRPSRPRSGRGGLDRPHRLIGDAGDAVRRGLDDPSRPDQATARDRPRAEDRPRRDPPPSRRRDLDHRPRTRSPLARGGSPGADLRAGRPPRRARLTSPSTSSRWRARRAASPSRAW